jgi:NADPH:quinone reductase-like Zn-dependent oxidoreductase
MAASLTTKHGRLEVGAAAYTSPRPDQIVVENRAVAINPLDWIIQVEGNITYGWLQYPAVLGSDVAGVVVEVGSAVTRFRIGDRVLGHAVGTDKDANSPAEGAFQRYTVLLERMTAPVPADLSFEDAATLPLAVSTAACALFQSDQLALRSPSSNPVSTGKTVLIWGGSTSVGSQAIQLAVAAGYDVISTSSPRNFHHVKALGAKSVFDYNSPTVVKDISVALQGQEFAGALALGPTAGGACVAIARASTGNRMVVLASPAVDFAVLAANRLSDRVRVTARLIRGAIGLQLRARRARVKTAFVVGTTLKTNDVSTMIYEDYLPAALREHRHQISPRPQIVGTSLNDIQAAMDTQRGGVSARKLVVTLPAEDR